MAINQNIKRGMIREQQYCCPPEGMHDCIAVNHGNPLSGFLAHGYFQIFYRTSSTWEMWPPYGRFFGSVTEAAFNEFDVEIPNNYQHGFNQYPGDMLGWGNGWFGNLQNVVNGGIYKMAFNSQTLDLFNHVLYFIHPCVGRIEIPNNAYSPGNNVVYFQLSTDPSFQPEIAPSDELIPTPGHLPSPPVIGAIGTSIGHTDEPYPGSGIEIDPEVELGPPGPPGPPRPPDIAGISTGTSEIYEPPISLIPDYHIAPGTDKPIPFDPGVEIDPEEWLDYDYEPPPIVEDDIFKPDPITYRPPSRIPFIQQPGTGEGWEVEPDFPEDLPTPPVPDTCLELANCAQCATGTCYDWFWDNFYVWDGTCDDQIEQLGYTVTYNILEQEFDCNCSGCRRYDVKGNWVESSPIIFNPSLDTCDGLYTGWHESTWGYGGQWLAYNSGFTCDEVIWFWFFLYEPGSWPNQGQVVTYPMLEQGDEQGWHGGQDSCSGCTQFFWGSAGGPQRGRGGIIGVNKKQKLINRILRKQSGRK